ncbi:head-tail connector protein [Clostridium cochlearium]|uniref:head-tail connector protein n=1 Tax=Clostridium cochlearium TaxID=1494 RepID=UPI000BBC7A22|nr:head-tail connector protein [Clostridium cochlearium]
MIITVEEAKRQLRIDSNEEDLDIEDLIKTAEEYLINAGCILNKSDGTVKNIAKLAVKLLVTHWYENREPIGKADKLAFSLDTIILQLKYC